MDPGDFAASAEPDDQAIRTRLARVMTGADFPVLSRKVAETLGALDNDAKSLRQITEVVLREYGLTMSVLRAANSAHYRRGGRPTESATQAMMVLGASVVRELAASMVLFEHFRRRSPALKELIVGSLLTANLARATARQLGEEDAEAALLCGMFRNLGEVLTAGYFHEDYQRIQSLVHDDGRSEAEAIRMALGCSYADFGAAVAATWALPDLITETIRWVPGRPAPRHTTIATFSDALTRLVFRPDSGEHAGMGLDALLDSHQHTLGLTRAQVGQVVSEALAETHAVLRTIDDPGRTARALSAAARRAFGAAFHPPDAETVVTLEAPDASFRSTLLRDLEPLASASSGMAIGSVLLQTLEVLTRGGPFDRALICFFTTDRLELMARMGVGTGAQELVRRFVFPVAPGNGPLVALTQQRQSLYLPTDRALSRSELRWAGEFGVSQFGVFPLVVLGTCIGCVYVDRTNDHQPPDRATVRFAQAVTEMAVSAIANRRR